jgi:hypothetical protein
VDPKHHNPSVRHPTWGRVGLELSCPRCGDAQNRSTQNNLHRPWAAACRRCGLELYREEAETPRFRAFDAEGRLLYRHDASTYVLRLDSDLNDLSARTVLVLCDSIGVQPEDLARRAGAGAPIYEQGAYAIAEPLRFSENLNRMAFALIRDGAEFRLLHNGRDLKLSYLWQLELGGATPRRR